MGWDRRMDPALVGTLLFLGLLSWSSERAVRVYVRREQRSLDLPFGARDVTYDMIDRIGRGSDNEMVSSSPYIDSLPGLSRYAANGG